MHTHMYNTYMYVWLFSLLPSSIKYALTILQVQLWKPFENLAPCAEIIELDNLNMFVLQDIKLYSSMQYPGSVLQLF